MADGKTLSPLSASDIRYVTITLDSRQHYFGDYVTAFLCRFLTPPVSPSLGSRRLKARPTWTPPLSPSHPRSRRTRLFDEAASPDSPRSTGDGDGDHLSVFPYLESEKKKFLMAAASNKVIFKQFSCGPKSTHICTIIRKLTSARWWSPHPSFCPCVTPTLDTQLFTGQQK